MTISTRFTTVSRLRACRADTSTNCQNSPAKASAKRPNMRLNYLISIWFSAAGPALRRFFPVLSLLGRENQGGHRHLYSAASGRRSPKVRDGFLPRSARLVLDRAAIGAGRGDRDRLAGGNLVEGGDEIVLGGLDVGQPGRRGVVDRTHVGDPAAAIDDHHVRCGPRVVEVADDALRVEKVIGGCGLPAGKIGFRRRRGHIA